MKKKVWLSLLVVAIIGVAGLFIGLEMKYSKLEASLKEHLINVEGYKESDILSIEAKLSKMPKYPVYVEFADDPGTKYIFTDRQANQWTQLDPKSPQRLKNVQN
ncbi:DUF3139 domain-containing protein [Paenibacillus xylanexedens]|uniref:DUF3139 domain-containing protein n=1 Tax=Paenibacillus xylanexedens TaxID=528191 RepID=UPI003D03779E